MMNLRYRLGLLVALFGSITPVFASVNVSLYLTDSPYYNGSNGTLLGSGTVTGYGTINIADGSDSQGGATVSWSNVRVTARDVVDGILPSMGSDELRIDVGSVSSSVNSSSGRLLYFVAISNYLTSPNSSLAGTVFTEGGLDASSTFGVAYDARTVLIPDATSGLPTAAGLVSYANAAQAPSSPTVNTETGIFFGSQFVVQQSLGVNLNPGFVANDLYGVSNLAVNHAPAPEGLILVLSGLPLAIPALRRIRRV